MDSSELDEFRSQIPQENTVQSTSRSSWPLSSLAVTKKVEEGHFGVVLLQNVLLLYQYSVKYVKRYAVRPESLRKSTVVTVVTVGLRVYQKYAADNFSTLCTLYLAIEYQFCNSGRLADDSSVRLFRRKCGNQCCCLLHCFLSSSCFS